MRVEILADVDARRPPVDRRQADDQNHSTLSHLRAAWDVDDVSPIDPVALDLSRATLIVSGAMPIVNTEWSWHRLLVAKGESCH